MFRLWRKSKTVSKLNTSLTRVIRDTWLMMGQGKGMRIFILVSLLILVVVPVVLVTVGFDIDRVASFGYAGVFFASFLASTTIIFPAPGVAVVVVAAALFHPAWVALVAAVGGSLGEFTAYLAGYGGRVAIGEKYGERYKRAEGWMKQHGSVTLALFAFMPFLLFDLPGIAAGALRFPFWKFLLACFAGRLPRSFIESYLGWWILPRFLH